MIYAHQWSDLGEDKIPRWPSKIDEPRPIEIEISSWVGISIGAKHVMLRIAEQENAWWCEDRNDWMILSCDSHKRGFSMSADVYSEQQAIEMAIYFLRDVMKVNAQTHVIERDYHYYLSTIKAAVFVGPSPGAVEAGGEEGGGA